jgi:uncharacterized protein (TIGR03067 family)
LQLLLNPLLQSHDRFAGDKFTVKKGDKVIQAGTQKLVPSKSPKTLDVMVTEGLKKGAVMLGIYEIDGDTLRVCFARRTRSGPRSSRVRPDRRLWSTSTSAPRSESVAVDYPSRRTRHCT